MVHETDLTTEDRRTCADCGHRLGDDAQFCARCGTAVESGIEPTDPRAHAALSSGEYMGFWVRLAAEIVDSIILAIALFVLVAITTTTSWLWILIAPIVAYGIFKHLKCQTLGRKLFRIKVVNAAGDDVSFWRGALRETGGKFMSGLFLYLGFLWIGWDQKKRGWHDHIAGTYVVRARRGKSTEF